jgi:type IV pilus assembly protein PilQ
VRQPKQIITSLMMGGALAALSATTVNAAQQPSQSAKSTPNKDLVAQATQQPLVPNPKITIDGVAPTPGVGLASPLMPRAVAPPVGDISVSNLDASIPQLDLGSTAKVNMVLKNTPAREVLESLARTANLNLAYSDGAAADGKSKADATVSINLRNEPVQNAFNYVLQLSGLEANRIGNTIFVGTRLPDSIRETIVRTLRMNQVSSTAAATFLGAQGADAPGAKAAAGTGPQLLKGLSVSTDERLNAVTLVGSPRQVEMATSFLTRLDARRRQVALNVKIVDVNLSNADSMSNSLSFKAGDGFLSVDNGAAVYNYGGYNPATKGQVLSSPTTPPVVAFNLPGGNSQFLDYQPNGGLSSQGGLNTITDPLSGQPITSGLGNIPRPSFGTDSSPYLPGVTAFTPADTGFRYSPTTGQAVAPGGILTPAEPAVVVTPAVAAQPAQAATFNAAGNQLTPFIPATPAQAAVITPAKAATFNTAVAKVAQYTYGLPTNLQIPTKFLSTLQAQIISGNGKILTDPTLVVQEGQKSTVNLTQQVFGGFKSNTVAGAGATTSTREPIIKEAGLTLDIVVNRIDDNGYISVGVKPTVSSIGGSVSTGDGEISLLQSRTLDSGEIRLRDGQTLILSGIIQESDRTSVSKVPILGDIPILGALFRSTNKSNQRQEVVVLLTPQILDDNKTQVNYTPGVDARLMLGR